jgi:hypothetical protein
VYILAKTQQTGEMLLDSAILMSVAISSQHHREVHTAAGQERFTDTCIDLNVLGKLIMTLLKFNSKDISTSTFTYMHTFDQSYASASQPGHDMLLRCPLGKVILFCVIYLQALKDQQASGIR